MSDWQCLATYNKIGLHNIIVYPWRMSVETSEIDRLNTLDPTAIANVHDRYYPEVYRFARFRVSDGILAEDIASDVFMRLLEAVHSGRGPHTNLRGWLLRTTANIVNDHYRNFYKRPIENSAEVLETRRDLFLNQTDPDVISDEVERKRLLQHAIDELTGSQQLVITLRFGNRLSLEESAQIMGKSVNTIKALQYRAIVMLRRKLGKDFI